MFASEKPGWHLFFILLAAATFLYTFIGLGYDRHVFSTARDGPQSGILSTKTINALYEDAQLRSIFLSMTEQLGQTSNELGERFGIDTVRTFGTDLTNNVMELRKRQETEQKKKRGFFDDLGKAFQGFIGGGDKQGGAGLEGVLGGLLPKGLNLTGGIGGIFDKIGDSIVGGLQTPALFLGIGVGMGAASGLNLSDMANINQQATKIATAFNSSATGVNLIAQNLGSGVAGQLTSSLSLGNSSIQFAPIAFALASGIGNATSRGLNLTSAELQPLNGSSLEAIAGNLGLGVTMPIVSNIDLQAITNGLGGNGIGASVMQKLPNIAAAAGQGLGEGVKNGLGLASPSSSEPKIRKRQQSGDPLQDVDVPRVVGEFVKGLSQSVLTGVDVKTLPSKFNIGNPGSMIDIRAMLPGLAAGAGSGIGVGLSVGLNYKPYDATPLIIQDGNMSDDNVQAATVAELFTQNLVSNFLLNSTAIKDIGSQLTSGQPTLLKDLTFAKAAEGFARGAVEGAMTAFSSVGGLQNLISGNFSSDSITNVPTLSPTKFDDSLNGSAVSFARGLAGEGTILVADIFKRMKQGASDTASQPPQKRSSSIKDVALSTRQAPENTTSPFPDLAVSEATVMAGAQLVVDKLTCKGIGGAASIGLGVLAGGGASLTDMVKSRVPLDPRVTQSLPEGPIEIRSEGNTFRIVLRDADIRINELAVVPFGVLTALHILFMVISFLLALPVYLLLGAVWRVALLCGFPVNETKNKRWRKISLGVFFIFAFIGVFLGIAGMGSSRHFRDAHGVLGLITTLLIFPTVVFSIVRLRTKVEYPPLAYFVGVKAAFGLFKTDKRAFIISGILTQLLLGLGQILAMTGFGTLRSISLCVVDAVLSSDTVFGITGVLLMTQLGTTGLLAFRSWLEQHIAKRQAAGVESVVVVEKGETTLKDSVSVSVTERKRKPAFLNTKRTSLSTSRPVTEDLKGSADSKISTPFNVRKEGAESEFSPSHARGISNESTRNPFLSPQEQKDRDNNRAYNPKTGGYEYQYTSAIDDNDFLYDEPGGYKARTESGGRPSSELYPSSAMPPGNPKTENVSVADLFPPPPPQPDDIPIQLTSKSRTSSFSRPFGRLSIEALRSNGGPYDAKQ